jgi:cell division protein ZapE
VQIARSFHTVVIDGIPILSDVHRNAAKRFILLIDTLYDSGVKVIASAAAEPEELLKISNGWEAQEFRRTASRLIEMRSADYLALPHGRRDSRATGDTTGLVET